MIYFFYALHIIVCLFLILVVLLQQGKGADLSVFGGGSTQTAFGARGAATLLHKLTVTSFVLFIVTTMGIAILKGGGATASSVMSDVETEQTAPVEAATETPAAETPDAAPAEAPETPADAGAAAGGDGAEDGGDGGGEPAP